MYIESMSTFTRSRDAPQISFFGGVAPVSDGQRPQPNPTTASTG